MAYTYKYPRPAVTADCIVITKEAEPKLLLIQRGNPPYKGAWAFPGVVSWIWMRPRNSALSGNWRKKRGFGYRMYIRLVSTPRLTVTQEGEPSLLLIWPSSMSLLLSLVRMMLPKQNGGPKGKVKALLPKFI